MKPKNCPVCNFEFVSSKTLSLNKKYSYQICSYCESGILSPFPLPTKLVPLYDSYSYFDNLAAPHANRFIQSIITLRFHKTPSEFVNEKAKKGKILDVGCGNGDFLVGLGEGWEKYGVDVSKFAVKITQSRIGRKNVWCGFFPKLKLKKNFFDVITFWHVLEHLTDPNSYIKHAYHLSHPGGLLVGEMPNVSSPSLNIFKNNYSWLIVPDHCIYYSKKGLQIMLKKNGFKDIAINTPPRALLNLSLSLNKWLGYKKVPLIVRKIIFVLTIPITLTISLLAAYFTKGEVLRFTAQK